MCRMLSMQGLLELPIGIFAAGNDSTTLLKTNYIYIIKKFLQNLCRTTTFALSKLFCGKIFTISFSLVNHSSPKFLHIHSNCLEYYEQKLKQIALIQQAKKVPHISCISLTLDQKIFLDFKNTFSYNKHLISIQALTATQKGNFNSFLFYLNFCFPSFSDTGMVSSSSKVICSTLLNTGFWNMIRQT